MSTARPPDLSPRALPGSGLDVLPLGYGTSPLGNLSRVTSDETALAAVDAAWDAGIRYYDTAPHYGLGLAERRLGAALRGRPRREYLLSTKVGRLLEPNPHPTGSDLANGFAVSDQLRRVRDYSGDGVRRSLDASLARIGVDRVDIALVHDPDDYVEEAISQAIPALARLRAEGVVSAIGIGMNQWQACLAIIERAELDIVMIAGRWTLADRSAAALLDACHDRGIAVFAAAPFNSGLLARPEPPDDASYDYGPAPADVLAHARALTRTTRAHHALLPHAALQFPLTHPAVRSVVTGLRDPRQVTSAAHWITTPLPVRLWESLGLPTPRSGSGQRIGYGDSLMITSPPLLPAAAPLSGVTHRERAADRPSPSSSAPQTVTDGPIGPVVAAVAASCAAYSRPDDGLGGPGSISLNPQTLPVRGFLRQGQVRSHRRLAGFWGERGWRPRWR